MQTLDCSYNSLTSLDVSTSPNLQELLCYFNSLTSLDVSTSPNLQYLDCGYNDLTSLDVSNTPNLQYLGCSYNSLTSLDVSTSPNLQTLDCDYNDLTSLLIKNGSKENIFSFFQNPNLGYICCDESQLQSVIDNAIFYNLTNCQINTYCSYPPGGNYNTIAGIVQLDVENNNCSENAVPLSWQVLQLDDEAEVGYTISNQVGEYNFYCYDGIFNLQPLYENPYFSASSATVSFDTTNSLISTQNFCITPNGTHHDLEITLLPVNGARPGFDAKYQISYQNQGTETESGSVSLQFDDSVLDFVSASPNVVAQSDSLLTWNFVDLQPFESRSISITLNVNSPQEIPAVNDGDILSFLAYLNYAYTDETPEDNSSALRQTVVNSFDPNDKTCLQGTEIEELYAGDYLDYVIRFQNTGSAEAINVIVTDELAANLDVSTFQMIAASHDYRFRLEGRTVEFYFENINLPDSTSNESESHGFVAFKIKPDLVSLGDRIENTAEIYFDYNFPIITNTTETEIVELTTLAVDWLYFDAIKVSDGHLLTWATAQEHNSDFFEVQRSDDATHWRKIGVVKAQGESSYSLQYDFVNSAPLEGINYYRLRQQDRDGKELYSKVVSIREGEGISFALSPNPASEYISLGSKENIAQVEIYDSAGRLRIVQTSPDARINIQNLPSGVYTLKAQIGEQWYAEKFVVSR